MTLIQQRQKYSSPTRFNRSADISKSFEDFALTDSYDSSRSPTTVCQTPKLGHKSNVRFDLKTPEKVCDEKKVYSIYTKGRKGLKQDYETKKSDREWWRAYLKETPGPGHYEYVDFFKDYAQNPVKSTYNFLGQGRKKSAGILQRGELLQPGRYQHINFIDNLERKSASSAFKSSGRSKKPDRISG